MNGEVVISTEAINSYGTRVLTNGIDLTQYKRNPILLWMHNRAWRGTDDEVMPLGQMTNLRVEGDVLYGTPVFDNIGDFTQTIAQKWEAGTIKMVSAGLNIVEQSDAAEHILPGQRNYTITKSKLIEVSIVDLGSNDDALALYQDGKLLTLTNGSNHPLLIELKTDLKPNLKTDKMKQVAITLGLLEAATEQEVLVKVEALQQQVIQLTASLASQQSAAIEASVDRAIASKKITADKKAHFVALGQQVGLESLDVTLGMISGPVKPIDIIGGSAATLTSYTKLSEVPHAELAALKENDKERYSALYQAEYGISPKY